MGKHEPSEAMKQLGVASYELTDNTYRTVLDDGYVITQPRKHTAEDIVDSGAQLFKLIKEHYRG